MKMTERGNVFHRNTQLQYFHPLPFFLVVEKKKKEEEENPFYLGEILGVQYFMK